MLRVYGEHQTCLLQNWSSLLAPNWPTLELKGLCQRCVPKYLWCWNGGPFQLLPNPGHMGPETKPQPYLHSQSTTTPSNRANRWDKTRSKFLSDADKWNLSCKLSAETKSMHLFTQSAKGTGRESWFKVVRSHLGPKHDKGQETEQLFRPSIFYNTSRSTPQHQRRTPHEWQTFNPASLAEREGQEQIKVVGLPSQHASQEKPGNPQRAH